MDGLSPFTRRFVAIGLLLVAVISALNLIVLPLGLLLRQSVAQLGDARFQRSELEAIVARPAPKAGDPIPPSSYVAAGSGALAFGQLEARVRAETAAAKIHLLSFGPRPQPGSGAFRLSAVLSAEGDEVALVGFIGALEQHSPLIRLSRWHIARPTADGPLHLDAQIDAVWGHSG